MIKRLTAVRALSIQESDIRIFWNHSSFMQTPHDYFKFQYARRIFFTEVEYFILNLEEYTLSPVGDHETSEMFFSSRQILSKDQQNIFAPLDVNTSDPFVSFCLHCNTVFEKTLSISNFCSSDGRRLSRRL